MKLTTATCITIDEFFPILKWFGYYKPGSKDIMSMNETELYQEDWIGLRWLMEHGKVITKLIEGEHMRFSLECFREQMLPYLLEPSPWS